MDKTIKICIVALIFSLLSFQGRTFAACSITVTNTNDSGAGSFRQALQSANGASNVDTICFSIGTGPRTISVLSVLPAITQPVIIDGTTQPGFAGTPIIEINGSSAGSGTSGIQINAGGSTIKGLVVNRFGNDGIILYGGSGNTIVGNYVGTDITGTVDYGNGSSGVGTLNSSNNVIGGTSAADRNVISGNQGMGVSIAGSGSTGNSIVGNYIGTNYMGTAAVGNSVDGVIIASSATGNTIGGTSGVSVGGACTGACNLVSGNGANGIGLGQTGTSGNSIKGNYVGTDVYGTNTIPNYDIGIEAQDSPNNTIGGTTPQERNIVSGNGGAGVSINGTTSTGNIVSGNFIGTDVSGSVGMGNKKMGINIGSPTGGSNNASSNTIGGITGVSSGGGCTGSCNVIAANNWSGIYISGTTGGSNQIVGNYIGNSVSGGITLPNFMDGIGIVDSSNNRIGGPTAQHKNIISGNGGNGIAIVGAANGTRIEQNYIGIATDQNTMPNRFSGIAIGGGVDAQILTNSIFGNGHMGIDLGLNGVSLNDVGDADGGPNRTQNYPTIRSIVTAGNTTTLSGVMESNANTGYRIEFFMSPICSGYSRAGFGQGKTFIGSTSVATNATGTGSFSVGVPKITPGYIVVATATKLGDNNPYETSEFSPCAAQQSVRAHPDGALIRPSGSANIFIIESGATRPIGSVEVLQSYKIGANEFKTATLGDTLLPGSPSLYFREGTLLRGSGPDVFVIDQVSQYGYVKRKITSIEAFVILGYTVQDIITVPDSALGLAEGSPLDVAAQHPDGALIIAPGSPAVYLIENGKKRLVGSSTVLISQRITPQMIKPATAADLSLPQGQNLGYREGTVIRGSAPTVYIADDVTENGIIISKKRQVSSIEAFVELGYTLADVLTIPDSDLATLPTKEAL